MNQQTLMLALFVALGVVVITGLIAIPVIEAEARSATASERNKRQQGEESSGGKSRGRGSVDI